MTITEIAACCQATIVTAPADAPPLNAAYTSDLLSDVIGHAPPDSILITIQNHLNTIAVATLAEVHAILICHDRPIPDEMRTAAERESIALLRTPLDQFHASCRLASLVGS